MAAEPMEYPLVMALVTLPHASSWSVAARTDSSCWLISAMPPVAAREVCVCVGGGRGVG